MRPVLFSLGGFDFHSAPAFAGFSALTAFFYFRGRAAELKLGADEFWRLMLHLMAGVLFGSVGLYVVFYNGGLRGSFQDFLDTRRIPGGSFLGAFWGAVLAASLFSRQTSRRFPPLGDTLAASGLLALVVMRLGCFLNGCCHGRPTTLSWAVVFTDPRCSVREEWLGVPLHPTQLYESAGCLLIFLAAHFRWLKRVDAGKARPGTAFTAALAAYCVLRFGLEFLRGGEPGIIDLAWANTAQLITLASLAAAVALDRRWRTGP